MRRAFVMVNADLGSEDELQSELKKVEGVVGVYQVYGVYDMIVQVEAESDQKLKEILFFQNSFAQAREVYAPAHNDRLIGQRTASGKHVSIKSRSSLQRTMPQYAQIKLTSSNLGELEGLAWEIKEIAEKTGVKSIGPQPLPTKTLKLTTRKAPTGEGTHTFDHWQLRIHRRLIYVEPNDRAMRQITKLKIPEDVKIEITLTS